MVPHTRGGLHTFKHFPDRSGRSGSGSRIDKKPKSRGPEIEYYILCRACRRIITHPGERIAVGGGHEHAFANPQGIIFQVGCFRSASGCGYAGRPTEEFTWFRGFSWRIALCSTCQAHLGWLFASTAGGSFHAMILERLIFPGG